MNTDDLLQAFLQDFTTFVEQQMAGGEALRLNDERHLANLTWLERALGFFESDQPQHGQQMLIAFLKAEAPRIEERAAIVVRFHLTPHASPHGEQEMAFMRRLSAALARRREVQE